MKKEKLTCVKKIFLVLLAFLLVLSDCRVSVPAAGKFSLKQENVKLNAEKTVFNGKVQKPVVSVKYQGRKLKQGKDYVVKYSGGFCDIGVYQVAVSGTGKYQGAVYKKFTINPSATSILYIASSKKGTELTASWKKQKSRTSGYQIQYSASKKMLNPKVLSVKDKNITKILLKKLNLGTGYYLRIRTYATVKGKKYYSEWSKIKKGVTAGKIIQPVVTPVVKPTATPKPAAFEFKQGSETMSVEAEKYFEIETTNSIEKIEISDTDTVQQYFKYASYYYSFYASKPGKVTITFEDEYGQKLQAEVRVTQNLNKKGTGNVTVVSVESDPTLPIPVIERIQYGSYGISVYFLSDFSSDDPYEGCEAQISKNPEFKAGREVTEERTNEKYSSKMNYGSVYFSFSRLPDQSGSTYYLRTRTYKIEENKKIAGSWSEIRKIDIPSDNQITATPEYSYELYYLDKETTDVMYTGYNRILYLKTDNPDPNTIYLKSERSAAYQGASNWRDFNDDIIFQQQSDNSSSLQKVEGGYVTSWEFTDPGIYQIEIRERSLKGYIVVGTVTVEVKDTDEAKEEWMKEIIQNVTTDEMNPFEKMDAVCKYLDSKFKYLRNNGKKILSLATAPNGPYFATYHWDSMLSPAALCGFAKLIGGFDEIHNCYYDREDWQNMHAKARLTIGDETRYFSACPLSSSGYVENIETVDFSNTENFRQIY